MKYDKINLLYRTPISAFAPGILYKDLENNLRKNELLHYAYDLSGKEPLNLKEFLKYPVLCINGSWEPLFDIVKSISGRQFVAELNSELLFKGDHYKGLKKFIIPKFFRIGKYFKILKEEPRRRSKEFFEEFKMLFKINISKDYSYPYKVMEERSKYFNLYFSAFEEELNKYFGKACYWYCPWVDTDLLNNIAFPLSNKILFVGAIHRERINFFKQDKNKIIEIRNTAPKKDSIENIKELCKLINNYKYTICPIGVTDKYIPGKIYEYMACKRLCFCYLPEGSAFRIQRLFENGKEIVYFKTFPELEEKYRYYLKNPKKADLIAQAGYKKIREYHNADIRAKRFAEIILHHANGGRYDKSFNNISLFGGKSILKL